MDEPLVMGPFDVERLDGNADFTGAQR